MAPDLVEDLIGDQRHHDTGADEQAESIPGLAACRFYGLVFFANVDVFIERLQEIIDRAPHPVRQVLIDASADAFD